jgi:hypothetical protein
LLDCWPTDLPDPKRFAASALMLVKPMIKAKVTERNLPCIVNSKMKSIAEKAILGQFSE